ncbi:MAG: hydroxyacylglutathione hydrolase [Acetobacteraceae bacterium]|nr:hydroxyacylglutathione hydrolase [Acetobacteraceae bacterium]
MSLTVLPIPILSDNYAWFLRDEATGMTAVVDAAEAEPIAAFIEAQGGRLDWLPITHHHGDHIAGIPALAARYGAKVAGHAADAHRLPPLDLVLREGDVFALGESRAAVIDTPGHTRGHISFHFADGATLLCGDTLFAIGCGRLLEGSAEEMFASLAKLAALPDETRVCCGHEYTLSNIRYALTVEPDNAALRAFAAEAETLRDAGRPTIPTTLGLEKAANPFLHARDAAHFAALRTGKDNFR